MTPKRPPSPPPHIRGYEHSALLGAGGFSDVFVYEELATSRKVAVKVLLNDALGPGVRQQFETEARLMGQLSSHPAIVPVFNTGIAGDGRPYLVMEYCPLPNMGQRFRRERMAVTDVLRVGIEIAGAVETAHRAGILHRDVKPANILVTAYRRAVLTDFGISGMLAGEGSSLTGLSVPWAPPEFFADPPHSDVTSDVWGLAATVYSLLAGRSPFEIPGGDNSSTAVMARICNAAVPPLNRPDVPPALEGVLGRAMAKPPSARYETAIAFARSLQQVQTLMQLPVTPVDVLETTDRERARAVRRPEDDGEGTRVSVVSINPTGPPPGGPDPAVAAPGRMRHFDSPAPVEHFNPAEVTETRRRSASVAAAPAVPQQGRRRWPIVASAVVVLAAVGAVGYVASQASAPRDAPAQLRQTLPSAPPPAPVTRAPIPAVANVTGQPGAGGVTFVWTNPDPQDGDHYRWSVSRTGQEEKVSDTTRTSAVVPAAAGRTCIEVILVRDNGRAAPATEGCVP